MLAGMLGDVFLFELKYITWKKISDVKILDI